MNKNKCYNVDEIVWTNKESTRLPFCVLALTTASVPTQITLFLVATPNERTSTIYAMPWLTARQPPPDPTNHAHSCLFPAAMADEQQQSTRWWLGSMRVA